MTIAALYKSRWQVELFFKWIKQHLRIKRFLGTSENAVKTQIWCAVSTYVQIAIAPPGEACYAASKHALEGLHEALQHELHRFGIRVCLAEPGFIRTDLASSAATPEQSIADYAPVRQSLREHWMSSVPTGRLECPLCRRASDLLGSMADLRSPNSNGAFRSCQRSCPPTVPAAW